MKYLTLLTIFLFTSFQLNAQKPLKLKDKKPITIGESVSVYSEILKEDRILNIYLPNDYSEDSSQTYPVIYLMDGSLDEDFIHISGLVQFGSFSWINMLPETIVVGISNIDRKRDFTFPTTSEKDKKEYPTAGRSDAFINFIEKELQPYINLKYKAANTKTIIGQSLGGLLATEILFKKPELFDNYVIVSPSLWWDENSLLQLEPQPYSTKKGVYIAVGKEGRAMEQGAKDLYEKLNAKKSGTTKLHYDFFKDLDHGDTLHLAVYGAFNALFKTK